MLGRRRSQAKTRRARILIVDDQREMVEIIRDRLEHGGWEIATASNGAEGLEKAASHSPDLILLDTMMPIMNGHEMLARLRKAPDTRDIPVIMCTGCSETEDVLKASSYNVTDYITKPFDLAELGARIRQVLGDRGLV